MKLMTDGYAKYGEVFTVPVAHKSITFLIGPDVSPHFFKATDDEMSNTEVSATVQCALWRHWEHSCAGEQRSCAPPAAVRATCAALCLQWAHIWSGRGV
jgi:hypothetical protein